MNTLMRRDNAVAKSPIVSVLDNLLRGDVNHMFNDDFWGFKGINRQLNVPVNIHESENAYELEMYAPGMKKEDFKIDLNGDDLTISCSKKEEENKKEQSYIRQEFSQFSFSRNFHLDHSIDRNAIKAEYENGILKMNLPKKEEAKKVTRTIEIG